MALRHYAKSNFCERRSDAHGFCWKLKTKMKTFLGLQTLTPPQQPCRRGLPVTSAWPSCSRSGSRPRAATNMEASAVATRPPPKTARTRAETDSRGPGACEVVPVWFASTPLTTSRLGAVGGRGTSGRRGRGEASTSDPCRFQLGVSGRKGARWAHQGAPYSESTATSNEGPQKMGRNALRSTKTRGSVREAARRRHTHTGGNAAPDKSHGTIWREHNAATNSPLQPQDPHQTERRRRQRKPQTRPDRQRLRQEREGVQADTQAGETTRLL